MDALFTILICVLLLVVVYLALNYKVTNSIDQIFRNRYQKQLQTDIQEFYRELENYAVIFENRVQRFRSLVERQEKQLNQWETILTNVKTTKKAKEILSVVDVAIKNEVVSSQNVAGGQLPNKIVTNVPPPNQAPKQNTDTTMAKPDQATSFDRTYVPDKVKPQQKEEMQKIAPEESFAEEIISDIPSESDVHFKDNSFRARVGNADSIVGRGAATYSPPMGEPYLEQQKQNIPESTVTKFLGKLGGSISKSFLDDTTHYDREQHKKPLLGKEEVVHLIQDLSDVKKKPMALQVLLKGGFTVANISEMSDISYSDLEATKNIYRV